MENSLNACGVLGNLVEEPQVSHFAENTHGIGARLTRGNAKNFVHQRHTKCTERSGHFIFTAYILVLWGSDAAVEKCRFTSEFVTLNACKCFEES